VMKTVPCCGVGLGAIKVVVKLYREKETIAFQMFDNIDEWYGDLIRPGAAKPLMRRLPWATRLGPLLMSSRLFNG